MNSSYLNRVTKINTTVDRTVDINVDTTFDRDLHALPFTKEEQINSFSLFQEELKKDKFFIGRLSGNETLFVSYIMNNISIDNYLINSMLFGAGIQFKTKNDCKLYKELYNASVSNTTLIGIWDNIMYLQCKLYMDFIKDKNKMCASALDPFYYMDEPIYNLNNLLKNKKILIITSHKETTELQLNKLDHLFNKPIFDNNTFYIYKPAQQNGGSHDTNAWTHHYNLMTQDLTNIYKEFAYDLALVSAGGFGMLLCNFIYTNTGASVIYVGGSLQLYFGIMGKRWQNNESIIKNMNHNWVYPLDVDKPKNIEYCEGGCYW